MRSGICPKCESKEVHEVTKTAIEVAVPITWARTADLVYYICVKCGFVELYVLDPSNLPKIAEKYPRVKLRVKFPLGEN